MRAAFSICRLRGARGVAEGDVGGDRVRKKEALLEDEPDVAAQVVDVQLAHVEAVDQQAPGLGDVVEAQDQAHVEDALARTRRTQDGHAFARLHLEVDVAQDRATLLRGGGQGEHGGKAGGRVQLAVLERDVLEADGPLGRRWAAARPSARTLTSIGASRISKTRRAPISDCCTEFTIVATLLTCPENWSSSPAKTTRPAPSATGGRARPEPAARSRGGPCRVDARVRNPTVGREEAHPPEDAGTAGVEHEPCSSCLELLLILLAARGEERGSPPRRPGCSRPGTAPDLLHVGSCSRRTPAGSCGRRRPTMPQRMGVVADRQAMREPRAQARHV